MYDDETTLREISSVAELRSLYRAAEARSARLRLLVEAGRDLAAADATSLADVLASAGRRAAMFAGAGDARIGFGPDAPGLALVAPGAAPRKVGGLMLAGSHAEVDAFDREDGEALTLLAQLMGAAIDRVGRDIERDQLLGLLRERERHLEGVVARLFSIEEEERRRISRDLHDSVAQTAGALFRQLEAKRSGATPECIDRLAGMAQGLVRELRAAIADLRPTALDDLGLAAAVAALADTLSGEGFDVAFRSSGPERWPALLETAFFRVTQEAINNVRHHAGGPCRVDIFLDAGADCGRWSLRVRDHGRGPGTRTARAPAKDHFGLEVMAERMTAIGGRLDLVAPPGGGFEVIALLERGA
jgi:signal transduction histidine kinase